VTDISTGKDYGVVRNSDGSYRWFNPEKEKLPSQVDYSKNYYKDFINSPQYPKINSVKSLVDLEKQLRVDYPDIDTYPADIAAYFREGMA